MAWFQSKAGQVYEAIGPWEEFARNHGDTPIPSPVNVAEDEDDNTPTDEQKVKRHSKQGKPA
jgi:hypothetical protein